MSPVTDSSSDSHRAPLFDDPDDRAQRAEEQRTDAIHAALTDIMALDDTNYSKEDGIDDRVSIFLAPRSVKDRRQWSTFDREADSHHGEPEEDVHDEVDEGRGSFQLAGPGDLQLSYGISRVISVCSVGTWYYIQPQRSSRGVFWIRSSAKCVSVTGKRLFGLLSIGDSTLCKLDSGRDVRPSPYVLKTNQVLLRCACSSTLKSYVDIPSLILLSSILLVS